MSERGTSGAGGGRLRPQPGSIDGRRLVGLGLEASFGCGAV